MKEHKLSTKKMSTDWSHGTRLCQTFFDHSDGMSLVQARGPLGSAACCTHANTGCCGRMENGEFKQP